MKVNGFQVEEHGSGYAVTLRLHVGREEALDGMTSSADGVVLGALAAALAAAVQIGGVRSHDAKTKDGVGGASEAQVPGDEHEDAAGNGEDPKPAGRRARGGRRPAEPAAAASPGGRRKVNRGGAEAEDKGSVDPTPASAPTARRKSTTSTPRRGKGSASTADRSRSKKKGKITDEDLTKAASQAAAELGAPVVMDLVSEFGVEKVGDLSEAQRVKFVARIAEEREKADEK